MGSLDSFFNFPASLTSEGRSQGAGSFRVEGSVFEGRAAASVWLLEPGLKREPRAPGLRLCPAGQCPPRAAGAGNLSRGSRLPADPGEPFSSFLWTSEQSGKEGDCNGSLKTGGGSLRWGARGGGQVLRLLRGTKALGHIRSRIRCSVIPLSFSGLEATETAAPRPPPSVRAATALGGAEAGRKVALLQVERDLRTECPPPGTTPPGPDAEKPGTASGSAVSPKPSVLAWIWICPVHGPIALAVRWTLPGWGGLSAELALQCPRDGTERKELTGGFAGGQLLYQNPKRACVSWLRFPSGGVSTAGQQRPRRGARSGLRPTW